MMSMSPYTMTGIILTLSVLIGYLNHRFIKMQSTIAIMAGSILLSLFFLILQHAFHINIADQTKAMVSSADFQNLLIKGMLSFLLFAGSMTIDLSRLKAEKWTIGILA